MPSMASMSSFASASASCVTSKSSSSSDLLASVTLGWIATPITPIRRSSVTLRLLHQENVFSSKSRTSLVHRNPPQLRARVGRSAVQHRRKERLKIALRVAPNESAIAKMRRVERLAEIEDRREATVGGREARLALGKRERGEIGGDLADQILLRCRLRLPRDPLGPVGRLAESTPEFRLDGAEHDMVPVAGPVDAIIGGAAVQVRGFWTGNMRGGGES